MKVGMYIVTSREYSKEAIAYPDLSILSSCCKIIAIKAEADRAAYIPPRWLVGIEVATMTMDEQPDVT